MDLATVGGLLFAGTLTIVAILMGSPLKTFYDLPSILMVVLGSFGIMAVCFPMGSMKDIPKVVKKGFLHKSKPPDQILQLMREMSSRARREGVLVLEDMASDQDDDFLKKGIQMVVDGHDPSAIEEVLYNEIDNMASRHKDGADLMDQMGTYAPAMGMIGTLVGLVQMLQSLDDPASIGPAMAVALLTTFYGAIMANMFALPLAHKLKMRSAEEIAQKTLVVQGLLSILAGESPRFLVDRLNAQLPPGERLKEAS
jgi:chemotaxis protein MotA